MLGSSAALGAIDVVVYKVRQVLILPGNKTFPSESELSHPACQRGKPIKFKPTGPEANPVV